MGQTIRRVPNIEGRATDVFGLERSRQGLDQYRAKRLVWGTNWPHPSVPLDRKPDDAVLLDLLAIWAPDAITRNDILVQNPQRLYGFPPVDVA